jgi:DNA-binding IclR family transcriptional regulator
VSRERVLELLARGKGPTAVARELGIDRATVYRIVKQMRLRLAAN